MRVRHLTTKYIAACRPSDSMRQAVRSMMQLDCGFLPVLDLEDRLVAVLTDRDVCKAAFAHDLPLSAIDVSNGMTQGVATIGPDDTIEQAERTMAAARVRRLPVVDADQRLVGVLSLDDVARAISTEHIQTDVNDHGVAETLAEVASPRPKRTG